MRRRQLARRHATVGVPPEFGTTHGLQVAGGLLPGAEFRAGGAPDRGPWPWWWRVTIGVGALMVVGLGYLAWRRRTRRVAPLSR